MTKDPVCEMPIEGDEALITSNYNGRRYCFCSSGCKEEFEGDPEKYLKNFYMEEDEDNYSKDDFS
jgi:YHS domain-containing protein